MRLDYSPVAKSVKSELRRSTHSRLPSLAESVRSVEERVARRNSEHEALVRSHDRARALLESEQARSGELGRALAEQRAAAELAQTRLDEAVRLAEQALAETRSLRDAAAARDATIAQLQRSLAERDSQLSALQREHAQVVPSLEERSSAAVQLQADLQAARAQLAIATADLAGVRQAAATLTAQLERRDRELLATRGDLNEAKALAASHLERLRTGEYRRALNESSAGPIADGALLAERDELRRRVSELATRAAELGAQLAARDAEAQRGNEALSAAEQSRADLALKVLRLRAEMREREEQMEVLLAHLQESRRLIGQGNTDIQPPPGDPGAAARIMDQLVEENRALRAALDRTGPETSRTARTQPERTGAAPAYAVELIRIDTARSTAHPVGSRTRIGRAPGCEVHVEASSVSRHHAVVTANAREVVVEDLRSTNGVLVNGRKVTRQVLVDGDTLTIGEAQFRLRIKPGPQEPPVGKTGARPGPQ